MRYVIKNKEKNLYIRNYPLCVEEDEKFQFCDIDSAMLLTWAKAKSLFMWLIGNGLRGKYEIVQVTVVETKTLSEDLIKDLESHVFLSLMSDQISIDDKKYNSKLFKDMARSFREEEAT